jgi:hypothetical protein
VQEDEGRALLAAYLPAGEPEETPLGEVVGRAKAVRRRRRTVLAGAASVAAVLVASAIAVGAHLSAAPPARPAPTASSTPSGPPCDDVLRDGNDAGARLWARWVHGKVRPPAQPGISSFDRYCEHQTTSGVVVPTHTFYRAEFFFPDRPLPRQKPVRNSQTLTTTITRWERLPDETKPCQDDEWIQYVVCEHSTLRDGSRVVRRDYYAGRQATRQVARILPDGRAVGLYLTYVNPSRPGAFERMARTLDEMTTIATDPGALRYLPRP